MSVPKKCSAHGEILAIFVLIASNSYDESIGAKIANTAITKIQIKPITAPLFFLKRFKESFQAGSDGATTSLVMSCLSPTNSKSSGKNSIFSKSIINHPFLI